MIIRPTRYVPQGLIVPLRTLVCVDCKEPMISRSGNRKRCEKCLPAHVAKLVKKHNARHAAKNKAARRAKV